MFDLPYEKVMCFRFIEQKLKCTILKTIESIIILDILRRIVQKERKTVIIDPKNH